MIESVEDEGERLADAGQRTEMVIAGIRLLTDPLGVLFHPGESLLLVADLHLEKGSRWASHGVMLPPWDTAATLERLEAAVNRWRPRRVIALGDSFDDTKAGERISYQDLSCLKSLQTGREWVWVAGNHDPRGATGIGGDVVAEITLGRLLLRHAPHAGRSIGEIAGHLHPVARVVSRPAAVRRRCFVTDGTRCVMPAFGAYAGGLNVRDPAYDEFFTAAPRVVHVLGRARVYKVSLQSCAADARIQTPEGVLGD